MKAAFSRNIDRSAVVLNERLFELFRSRGDSLACQICDEANPILGIRRRVNSGSGYEQLILCLDLPHDLFVRIQPDLLRIQDVITAAIPSVLNCNGSPVLREVAIRPVLEESAGAAERT